MKTPSNIIYQRILASFVWLLVYDGAIRKWILPEAEQVVFILKDALLVATLLLWRLHLGGKRAATMHGPVRFLLMLYALWVCVEIGNFNLPNLMVGIWGLKSHLLYASMVLILPLAFHSVDECLHKLETIFPWIVLPVCALAFVQIFAPADSFINKQVSGGLEGISFFGEAGLVRVTGTFSYLSGMAAFVQCTLLLGLSLYIWGARSSWFLLGLACVFAALPVTGSRSVIVISIFGSASLLFAAFMRKLIGFKALFSFMFMFAALAAISYFTQNSVWEALSQRAATAGDEDRVFTAFMSAFDFFDVAGFTGYGTGSANLGAVALIGSIAPFSWLPIGGGFEEEAGRIVLELGIIGWLLSLCLRIALFCWAIVLAVDGTTRNVRLVGVIALPVLALGVYQGTAVFGVPIWAVYNWCCVGFMGMAQHQQLQIRAARTAAQRDMALNRIRC